MLPKIENIGLRCNNETVGKPHENKEITMFLDPHPLRPKPKGKGKSKRAAAVLEAITARKKAAMAASPQGYKIIASRDHGTLPR